MVGEEEKPSLRRKPCRKPGWAAILPEERGCGPEWGLIFRGGEVYCRGYRQSLPERKERAFQEQQTKLVFIGSKLERSREASCGRFFRPFHRDSGIPPQQERKLSLKGLMKNAFPPCSAGRWGRSHTFRICGNTGVPAFPMEDGNDFTGGPSGWNFRGTGWSGERAPGPERPALKNAPVFSLGFTGPSRKRM